MIRVGSAIFEYGIIGRNNYQINKIYKIVVSYTLLYATSTYPMMFELLILK